MDNVLVTGCRLIWILLLCWRCCCCCCQVSRAAVGPDLAPHLHQPAVELLRLYAAVDACFDELVVDCLVPLLLQASKQLVG
jgi:hypothetical protein